MGKYVNIYLCLLSENIGVSIEIKDSLFQNPKAFHSIKTENSQIMYNKSKYKFLS